MTDPIILTAEIYTFIVIITASAVFARLALKSKNLGRFRVQLSIFILIWAAAEIPRAAMNLGLISTSSFGTVGLGLHFISMAAFAFFVGAKAFKYFGATPEEAFPAATTSMPGLPLGTSEPPEK